MNDSISELLAVGQKDPETGETILIMHRSKIIPDPEQDRNNWDDPELIAHINRIKESSRIVLASGKYYGIRQPLWVKPADENGEHMLIAGECRWRSTEDAPEEVQYLPVIIRSGDRKEARLDHTTENGARQSLTLFQVAESIKRDKEEFGLSTKEILAVHGISSKTQLSKYNQIYKLGERALEIVRAGYFQDVNLVYDLAKLNDEQLGKLEKKIEKGETFQQALRSVAPKAPKNGEGTGEGKVSGSETSKLSLALSTAAARALGDLLGANAELDGKEYKADLISKIEALAAASTEEQGEGSE
ncbi:ParB/RepB/Spo0J family partition protein (plasmid) [Pseudomonas amygdali pv. morsprunorum]|uniref:ParB-like N-terminal domain-containing protein n=1 Tax=Pseudomonas amygdali pv. ulmi TaxID=251720 RepID=A0A0Q0G0M7_PSEA0|nr:ParB N-terminal domain-containing protein [Pseudomonas amygdali]KPZ06412.1 hypothetical protein ALO41_200233 [Pseudomonas amygdali pv. ulmi]KWS13587.1 hypothetical protein AL065_29270 [Pseudomonas amygdali pv. ulmi]